MSRLRTLPSRIGKAPVRQMGSINVSERRITGTTLRNRRFKLWSQNPCCAMCGRLVDYPVGFELDHITPMHKGGADVESNCQILCVYYDTEGKKQGCHMVKSAEDANQ